MTPGYLDDLRTTSNLHKIRPLATAIVVIESRYDSMQPMKFSCQVSSRQALRSCDVNHGYFPKFLLYIYRCSSSRCNCNRCRQTAREAFRYLRLTRARCLYNSICLRFWPSDCTRYEVSMTLTYDDVPELSTASSLKSADSSNCRPSESILAKPRHRLCIRLGRFRMILRFLELKVILEGLRAS